MKEYYTPGKLNPNAAALLDNNVLWQKRDNQHAATAGQGGGVAAVLSTAFGAFVEYQGAKQEESRQAQQAGFVRAVEQYMKLEKQSPIDAKSWQTRWYYRGNISLKGVVMGILAQDSQGKTHRYIVHHRKPLQPGQRFNLVFRLGDGITLQQLQQMTTRYYLDDALPVN